MPSNQLTEEIIADLKLQNDNKPLYKKTLFNQDFVFSFISREEYFYIQEWLESNPNIKISDIETKIVDEALKWPMLSPAEWALLPAGAIPTLAKHIQEKSYLDTTGAGEYSDLSVETLVDYPAGEELTEETKEKLKKSCKHTMRVVKTAGSTYVIRPMLRPEYTYLQKVEAADKEIEGVKTCLIWPKNVDWNNMGAGVPTVLATQIMLLSGFADPSEVTEL